MATSDLEPMAGTVDTNPQVEVRRERLAFLNHLHSELTKVSEHLASQEREAWKLVLPIILVAQRQLRAIEDDGILPAARAQLLTMFGEQERVLREQVRVGAAELLADRDVSVTVIRQQYFALGRGNLDPHDRDFTMELLADGLKSAATEQAKVGGSRARRIWQAVRDACQGEPGLAELKGFAQRRLTSLNAPYIVLGALGALALIFGAGWGVRVRQVCRVPDSAACQEAPGWLVAWVVPAQPTPQPNLVATDTPTLTVTPTFTPVPPIATSTATPTFTPTPTETPTVTPTPTSLPGEIPPLPCQLKLNGELDEDPVVVDLVMSLSGEEKAAEKVVIWKGIYLARGEKVCKASRADHIAAIVDRRPYKLVLKSGGKLDGPVRLAVAADEQDYRLEYNPAVEEFSLPVKFSVTGNAGKGTADFTLEYQFKQDGKVDWKPVDGLVLRLTWQVSLKPTPMPQPTKTPAPAALSAPILDQPGDNAPVTDSATFSWRWEGPALAEDQAFEVRIWKEGQDHYGAAGAVREKSLVVKLASAYGVESGGGSGEYWWTVALVRNKTEKQDYARIGPEATPRKLKITISSGPQCPDGQQWVCKRGSCQCE